MRKFYLLAMCVVAISGALSGSALAEQYPVNPTGPYVPNPDSNTCPATTLFANDSSTGGCRDAEQAVPESPNGASIHVSTGRLGLAFDWIGDVVWTCNNGSWVLKQATCKCPNYVGGEKCS